MSNRLLDIKNLQIRALLDICGAINNNMSVKDLLQVYSYTLVLQKVNKIAFFYKNNNQWNCEYTRNLSNTELSEIKIDELYTFQKLTHINQTPLNYLTLDILIPVSNKNEPVAYILLGGIKTLNNQLEFKEELEFIETITNFVVVAIENKRLIKQEIEQRNLEKELELAEKVQNMLIPKELPQNDKISMSAVYKPHHNIGGDFFDYIPQPDNPSEFWICVADISGKGIAAAILMASFNATLRALVTTKPQPSLPFLIQQLNKKVIEITNGNYFISFFIAYHNLNTNTLTYVNAGHNPPLLIKQNKLIKLSKGCTVLGAIDHLKNIEVDVLEIDNKSFILSYTDGLTDIMNNNQEIFGEERLIDWTKKNHHLLPKQFNTHLLDYINEFKEQQAYPDDITILCYQIN